MIKQLNLQQQFNFGTESYKLYRKDSPETSIEAAHSVDTTHSEKLVYNAIVKLGECIQDDVLKHLEHLHLSYSTITARFSALIRKGCIETTGEKRRGISGRNQRVIRARNSNVQKV